MSGTEIGVTVLPAEKIPIPHIFQIEMICPLDFVIPLNFEICHLAFILDINDLSFDRLTDM